MVSTRRSGNGTAEHRGVTLRAQATQRQQQRQTAARQRREDAEAASTSADMGLPGVYRDMLIEAGVPSPSATRRRGGRAQQQHQQPTIDLIEDTGEPPVKRIKRPGEKSDVPARSERAAQKSAIVIDDDEDEEEEEEDDMQFEDIAIPEPVIQTRELDSEDEEDEDDEEDEEDDGQQFNFEDIGSTDTTPTKPGNRPPGQMATTSDTLELNLTEHENVLTTPSKRGGRWGARAPANRKKPLSRAERIQRVEIHKMHLLCLIAHAAQRNRWCNSAKVQEALRPLLTTKMISYLNPGGHLTQFGQTESLKNGIQQVSTMFKTLFNITERGMRRALWAESPDQLKDFELPTDVETVLDKDDFIAAAKSMEGSRDVGAQLFCALLRAAGVETRLAQGGDSENEAMFLSPRRRLGHPDAAAYNIPSVPSPPKPRPRPSSTAASSSSSSRHVVRGESAFPVYWVEVLDAAHQKWQPVDPLVSCTQWKPAKLEPPAADKLNQLSYAIGFAAEGDAKDVTRRYAKAYNAKTKRTRIDGLVEPAPTVASAKAAASVVPGSSPATSTNLSGAKWLRRALRYYRKSATTDVDQIEDIELNAAESREPMPRNVADFQNHPVYALVRHLRRHEVLLPNATAAGTVAAGAKAPLERIYRRKDVRIAYSADRWYRLGRVVLSNEIPAKWSPKPVSRKKGLFDDGEGQDEKNQAVDEDDLFGDGLAGGHPSPLGIPIFTPEQTELYRAPPVVDGIVPKNKFGNIEIYVPSMVPEGGEHIDDEVAGRAAYMLGVDYAPALSGFNFQGRKGTAVLRGVVVPKENAEAVRAVLDGLKDLAAQAVAERRTRAALRMWTVFLRGLRIRQRIRDAAEDRGEDLDSEDDGHEGEDEEDDNEEEEAPEDDEQEDAIDDTKSDVTEEFDMIMDENGDAEFAGGGGFIADDGDHGGGGFIADDEDYGGGGFIPE
ncbi:hypothetical protein Sste5346_005517 [Sporothrix stenoceras]|uniref:Xeroderma pigmentosum group C-complementing protein n=1 Tax=Sporothrix stenoceras TaxID=5173 RepID=A0ABR3Z4W3_9PEZI